MRRPSTGTDRGQSETIGTVLILGISLTIVVVTVVAGSAALSEAQSDAEFERMENSMSQFSSKASLVALGDAESKRVSIGSAEDGDVRVDETAGTLNVTVRNETTGDVRRYVYNDTTLGAVVYRNGDRTIAYQSGGVWRGTGDNTSRMVSPPEYHYRASTLTFPIVRVTGDAGGGGSVGARIDQSTVGREVYPNQSQPDRRNPLEDGVVVVEIQSDYYEGWYQFFDERAEGAVSKYDSNRTVVAELVIPARVTVDSGTGVTSPDDYTPPNGNADVDDPTYRDYPSADPVIDKEVEEAQTSNDNGAVSCLDTSGVSGSCTLDAGTYYIDGTETLSYDLDFDTSAGNVTIVVNGDFDISGQELDVTDSSDNGVEYYVNGTLDTDGGTHVHTTDSDTEPGRNVFYIADGAFESSGNPGTLDAVIYAPDADIDLEGAGSGDISGAVIANSLDMSGGGSADVTYPEDADPVSFRIAGSETTITYLHISENTIEITFG